MTSSRSRRSSSPNMPPQELRRTRLEHLLDTRSVPLAIWLLRRTHGRISRLWRRRTLVLTTRGRRTGLPRTVPLQFFPDGESFVVVAANSGLPRPPAWYLNLAAEPHATIEVEGRTLDVHADQLVDAEARAFWPRVLKAAPDYSRYPRRIGRLPPLLRLTSASTPNASHRKEPA
jgi:deazaflavin-dependent oxidoreductase (nitroreductase family)